MDKKSACFSLHAIRGSSMQIGARRVAKEVSAALEEQTTRGGKKKVTRRFKKLEAEFKRFVSVTEDYLSESCACPVEAIAPRSPELVKSKSDEVALNRPLEDKNLLSQSM
jgi:hypothetical protein